MLVLACASNAVAQTPDLIEADRPGLAESSTVIGKGRLQIEMGFQWQPMEDANSYFFPTLFRIGLSGRVEARIEGNTFQWNNEHGVRESGVNPISIGAKVVLHDVVDRKPGLGVIARVFPAWASEGFEPNGVTGDVRVALDWNPVGHISLNPNVGVGWYEDEEHSFTTGLFALTLSYAPRPNVSWFIDAGGQAPEGFDGVATAVVDAGVAYIPGQNWQIDVSAGKRAVGRTSPQGFVSIGFAYRHK